jgi:hypothetical protein
MRGRALSAVAVCYVLARVAVASTVPVNGSHPDAVSYQQGPNLIGGNPRPWVVPAIYALVDGRAATIFQAALSGVAFLMLAVAIASTMQDWRVRAALIAVIGLIGLSPRITTWDAALVSESVALSLTCLLIVTLIWLNRLRWWTVAALFTVWVFTRDAHLYLGVLVATGFGVWSVKRRTWHLAVASVAVLAWAGMASRNDTVIEEYNVTLNVAYHAGHSVDMFRWFIDHGMPSSTAFGVLDFQGRQFELLQDERFMEWARTEGSGTYARYLATHPDFVLEALPTILVDGGKDGEALVDHTYWDQTELPPGVPFWPEEASVYTMLLVLAGLAVLLVVRPLLPIVLLVSTVPHALLAYHATPWELARHGFTLGFVLVVACWWLIAAAIDARLEPPLGSEGIRFGEDVAAGLGAR